MISSFIRKTLVVILGFAFSFNFVGAQVNWVPPSGPPLSNNVPAPINTGPAYQEKEGSLKINETLTVDNSGQFVSELNSYLRGVTVFDDPSDPQDGAGWLFSFVKSSFFNDVEVGNGVDTFPELWLRGNLQYQPFNSNGTPVSPLTSQEMSSGGYNRVLIGNNSGDARWTDVSNVGGGGVIGGTNYNPTYQDDGTNIIASPSLVNFTGPGVQVTNTGNDTATIYIPGGTITSSPLPTCANDGDLLVYDEGNMQWNCSNITITTISDGLLPPGNQGETLQYDGGQWVSTNKIFHDQYSLPFPSGSPRTSIINDRVELNSPNVYLGQLNNGVTRVASPSFLVGNDSVATNAIFYSDSLKFRGKSPLATSALAPGKGRIAYSTDDEGSFKWNEFLRYERDEVTIPIPPFNIGVDIFRLAHNPDSLATIFVNEGMTTLNDTLQVNADSLFQDDVQISGETTIIGEDLVVNNGGNIRLNDQGDLYLEGITGSLDLANQEELCINMNTKRVHICKTNTELEIDNNDGRGSVTFYPEDNSETFTFLSNDNVDLEFCAGGSGGGGGGIGAPDSDDFYNGIGAGGGGGGGGAAGDCQTLSLNVDAGDVLSWEIGEGGSGGIGAQYVLNTITGSTTSNLSANGSVGQPTRVYLNGSQVGNTVYSTNGGTKGMSVSEMGPNEAATGGSGANQDLPLWWHNGAEGNLSSGNTDCYGCGGNGGDGESPAAENATVATGSRGGERGYFTGSQTQVSKYGKDGVDGKNAAGGGGGGGGYGQPATMNDLGNNIPNLFEQIAFVAGDGGAGGPGYVKISNIDQTGGGGQDEQVYTTPGAYTFNLQSLPDTADNLRIGIWAGGGAGGAAHYDGATQPTPTIRGGGGGAGEYVLLDLSNHPATNTCIANNQSCQIQVTVGSSGQPGQSGNSPGVVTASTNGTASSVSVLGINISAAPGQAGSRNSYNGSNSWNGAGGAGGGNSNGTQSFGTYSVTRTAGVAGQNASQGGLGANQNGGYGLGGNGVVITDSQAGNQVNISAAGSGVSGKVRIFWDQ